MKFNLTKYGEIFLNSGFPKVSIYKSWLTIVMAAFVDMKDFGSITPNPHPQENYPTKFVRKISPVAGAE